MRIVYDECPENPREWDNMGKLYLPRHKWYTLGDEYASDPFDEDGNRRKDVAFALPVYIYDHSGITVRHTPFGCPWDSWQVGWHYIERPEAGEMTNQQMKDLLEAELDTYDAYLRGAVFGYTTEDDSCWGFYSLQDILDNLPEEQHAKAREAWEHIGEEV